jgi:molybdopterin synthase catalytic subunit
MIEITDKAIDTQKIIDAASKLNAGAVNIFIGTVRNVANEKKVTRLEYEAYEPMAIAEIKKIFDEATARWKLLGWAFSHRVGVLLPGEPAVVVAISTSHRKESFEATAFILNELKLKVPIWKKEVFENGEEWVSARP